MSGEQNKGAPWIDLLKWVVGTVIIGLFSTSISNDFKRTELELKRMETDAKLIESVSGKFDTAANIQLKYLYYIEPFITTDSLKKGVSKKLALLRLEVSEGSIQTVKLLINKNLAAQRIDSSKFNKLKFRPTPAEPSPISELKKAEKDVAGDIVKTPLDSGVVEKLNNLKKFAVPRVIADYVLDGPPETAWVKKGYFVQFNENQLRIAVVDIDSRHVLLMVSSVKDKDDITTLQQNLAMTPGSTRGFRDPVLDFRYEVSLDFIGSAGRNPFTKASYITISTYRKVTQL